MLDALQQRMFGRAPAVQLQIGRFVVLELVGQGGMGRVYAAYDPQLERKVALKILRAPPGGSVDPRARSQTQREAKALARLSHPNVVTVFEVGEADGQEIIAMEFVEGTSLRSWMKGQHPWRAALSVLLDAGEGLAAAHRAGLVHRDFKPENVLVSKDGRVRVVDFGLARGDAVKIATLSDTGPNRGESTSTSTARAGTPAYMAPEQLQGKGLDARADQFSFCVTLYEALHGRRPSSEAPDTHRHRWPSRLDEVLRRGLEPDPDHRFASMDDLLTRLRAASRPRHLLRYVGAAVGIGAVVWFGLAQPPRATACDLAQQTRSDALHDVSMQSLGPAQSSPQSSSERAVVRAIQRYEQRWNDASNQTCDADSNTSEVVRELALLCLEDRRIEANAVIDSSRGRQSSANTDVEAAVHALPNPERCLETRRLLRRRARPALPGLHAAERGAREALAQTRAQIWIEGPAEQLAGLAELLERPVTAGDPGLRADILRLQAEALTGAGEPARAREVYVQAFATAEAAGDDRQRAEIALDVAVHVGQRLARTEAGLDWISIAQAIVVRLERPEALLAELEIARGRVLYMAGRYADSTQAHADALRLLQTHGALDPSDVAAQQVRLGGVMVDAGEAKEGAALLREALDRYGELEVGGSRAAMAHNNLSNALAATGEFEAAAVQAQRALALFELVRPATHPDIAMASNNLAVALASSGSFVESLEHFERASVVWEQHYGPEHPRVATAQGNLATALFMVDRWDEALKVGDRALAAQRKMLRPGHPDLALSLRARARSLVALSRHDEAVLALDEAEQIVLEALGDEHVQSASTRLESAVARLAAGRPREALSRLELACPRLVRANISAVQRGDCLFAWGRAAWLAGDRQRGEELLDQAATAFAQAEGEWPAIRGGIVSEWITVHVDEPGPEPPTR